MLIFMPQLHANPRLRMQAARALVVWMATERIDVGLDAAPSLQRLAAACGIEPLAAAIAREIHTSSVYFKRASATAGTAVRPRRCVLPASAVGAGGRLADDLLALRRRAAAASAAGCIGRWCGLVVAGCLAPGAGCSRGAACRRAADCEDFADLLLFPADGGLHRAHSAVLAASSEFFARLPPSGSGFREQSSAKSASDGGLRVVALPSVGSPALRVVLHFAYTLALPAEDNGGEGDEGNAPDEQEPADLVGALDAAEVRTLLLSRLPHPYSPSLSFFTFLPASDYPLCPAPPLTGASHGPRAETSTGGTPSSCAAFSTPSLRA